MLIKMCKYQSMSFPSSYIILSRVAFQEHQKNCHELILTRLGDKEDGISSHYKYVDY